MMRESLMMNFSNIACKGSVVIKNTACCIVSFKPPTTQGLVFNTLSLRYPHRERSYGFNSDEEGLIDRNDITYEKKSNSIL